MEMIQATKRWLLLFVSSFILLCLSIVAKAHAAWGKPSRRRKLAKRLAAEDRSISPELKADYEGGRHQRGVYYDVEEGSLRPMRRLLLGSGKGVQFGTRSEGSFASDGYYVGRYGQLICEDSFALIAQLGGGAFSTVWLALDVKGITNSAISPMVLSYRSDSSRYNSSSVVMAGRAFVVLKVSRGLPSYCRACEREFETHQELYLRLQRSGFNLNKLLIHSMMLREEAARSSHVVQVGDPCGPSLLEFVVNCGPDKGVRNHLWRLRFIKQMTRYVAEGLGQLHSCGIVHTDVKPENVLFRLPTPQVLQLMRRGIKGDDDDAGVVVVDRDAILSRYRFEIVNNSALWADLRDGKMECDKELFSAVEDSDIVAALSDLKIADLGNAVLLESFEDSSLTVPLVRMGGGSHSPLLHVAAAAHAFQTREYRAPEICLGVTPLRAALSGAMDVWSLGCMVFELVTGRYLLNPRSSVKTRQFTLSPHTPVGQEGGVKGGTPSPTFLSVGDRSASVVFEEELNLAHLAMIQEVCGVPPPPAMTAGLDSLPQIPANALVGSKLIKYLLLRALFGDNPPPADVKEELRLLVDWLEAIFQWEAASRPSIQDLLNHPWLASS